MSSTTNKKIFSCIGEFRDLDGRRKFVPDSAPYYVDRCSKMPLNKKFSCDFTTKIPTRSEAQLDYHWVLCNYISEHTGFTDREVHDFMMRKVFGTKIIKIGNYQTEVRESISDRAKLPKYMAVDLITADLELCQELEIVVPTPESLGYQTTKEKIKPITNYPEDIGTPTF
jgi:hypothetical protein